MLLTDELIALLLNIATTKVDKTEKEITHHDVRAWVKEAQKIVDKKIGKWIHVLLTSYDPLDTGRILQYLWAYNNVLKPSINEAIVELAHLVKRFSKVLQIGRTHGQHALPITVGFWLATILYRVIYNARKMESCSQELVGKISGAVGAYNAQLGLGIAKKCGDKSFERRVLEKLDLSPSPISTQILPPEPLAYFLHSCVMMSASFAQLGRDARHLMRTEIAEFSEPFGKTQDGSSTMAQKRNPISFESLEGFFVRSKNEFGKVLDTLISEHQRDLVGSGPARDFPVILVCLQSQLNKLLAKDQESKQTFISRLNVNKEACRQNFEKSAHLILAEPLYIALQMAGYENDAHNLVNHQLVTRATAEKRMLIEICKELAMHNDELAEALRNMPKEVMELLHNPENYTGFAAEKAEEIAEMALSMAA